MWAYFPFSFATTGLTSGRGARLDNVKTYNKPLCTHQLLWVEDDSKPRRWEWWVHERQLYGRGPTNDIVPSSRGVEVKFIYGSGSDWRSGYHEKTDSQITYELCFLCSRYRRKAKKMSFPTQLVPCQSTLGVNQNHRNKMTSRIW
jgi:hypothetical protein